MYRFPMDIRTLSILTHYIAKDIYSEIPRGAMQPRTVLFSSIQYVHNVLVETTGYTQSGNGHLQYWRTFHHDGKICEGGECTPTLLHYIYHHVLKSWYTLQLRGQIHFPYFYSTPICTLWLEPRKRCLCFH